VVQPTWPPARAPLSASNTESKTMKTVYLFDPATGVMAGSYDAQESPLEPGEFIAPAHSVDVAPPEFDPSLQSCAWNGSAWQVDILPSPAPDPFAPDLPPTPEQLRESAKLARSAAVAAIIVTTSAGNTFDGDEVAQGRMVRAVMAMQATSTPATPWVLADNTVVQVSATELLEALALAGAAQSALWVIL